MLGSKVTVDRLSRPCRHMTALICFEPYGTDLADLWARSASARITDGSRLSYHVMYVCHAWRLDAGRDLLSPSHSMCLSSLPTPSMVGTVTVMEVSVHQGGCGCFTPCNFLRKNEKNYVHPIISKRT